MAEKAKDYQDKYTKVHMKRDTYELAKARAKANNRTVANYIEHLVQLEADAAQVKLSSGVDAKVK